MSSSASSTSSSRPGIVAGSNQKVKKQKAEFEKAMVTKGMSPEQAATNLKRQAELAVNAYNKIDNVLRVQGFSKEGLNALKPMGIRPGLENFVLPNPANPASK